MDKKKRFASLMEDHSQDPNDATFRSLSPFGSEHRSGSGAGVGGSSFVGSSHTGFDLGHDLDQDQQAVLSCVTKETSQEDCARHRFIVWAAVKRNSSVHIPPQQKLECPLLRCTRRFQDHENMLKHLAGCRYLASGEYWCYEHNRVERFDDLKCKRCLGHPSKRRKILRIAKNFFHSLGHKSKKAHGFGIEDEAVPPPPYDSLNITPRDGSANELLSTEILEIDSVEVAPVQPSSIPPPSDVIDPQALLVPAVPTVPELDSTMLSHETLMQWQPLPGPNQTPFPFVQQEDAASRIQAVRPTLQLTTNGLPGRRQAPRPVTRPAPAIPRSKALSPSSSVRSTASTETNASTTSNGSSMISPVSNWSGVWSMASGLDTNMTSPVDGILADDLFTDAINNACPEFLHEFYSELPADSPLPATSCNMALDAVLEFDLPPQATANMAYAPEIVLTEDTAEAETDEPEVEQVNACCSETKSLVSSAWDALQEHLVSSIVKLQDHRDNYIANQLSSMSIRTVATTGLQTLRALLAGQQPSSASDALCFVHLVYAFSLVLHEQGGSSHFDSLFLQSLAYAHLLAPDDQNLYRQLVISIWQPPNLTQADINNHFALSSRLSGVSQDRKGKSPENLNPALGQQGADPLLLAARDFLDELETSLVMSQDSVSLDLQVQVSDLNIKHLKDVNHFGPVNEALLVTVKYILTVVSREFSNAKGLNSRLMELYRRLSSGTIFSVRRVEIELLHAGRCCTPAAIFFRDYVPCVRRLCDQVYEKLDEGTSRRDVYHNLGVSLIESLIPEFDKSPKKAASPPLDDIDALLKNLDTEVGDVETMAFGDMQPVGVEMFDLDINRVQPPTVTSCAATSTSSQTPSPDAEQGQHPGSGETPEQQQLTGQKVEANSCCEICGYRPKGDPQWFKGSMAKHKKLQHSTEPPKIYKCPYPGCTSQYKNRPDNLRQHQIEKNHWVQGDENTSRRPSKRKKVAAEE